LTNSTHLLIGRILLAIIFIAAGLGKLSAPAGFAGYLQSLGFPAPTMMAWLTILLEIGGGLAILAGFMTRYLAYALAAFCVTTAFLAHFDFADQNQMNAFMKNLAIAGGFLVLAASGAGKFSIDAKRT